MIRPESLIPRASLEIDPIALNMRLPHRVHAISERALPIMARLRRVEHGRTCPFIGVKRSSSLRARNDAIDP
jgi:hypothetical protein